MNKFIFAVFLFITLAFQVNAQGFFDPAKLTETGVYYYPEAWNPDQWDRDFQKMEDMGFEFTHMAEFAWAQIEPSEGKFDFAWLDKAVELAAKHHLKVIMCTPTATPPVWLTQKYPEVLVVMADGLKAMHGTREQYSWSSPKYRELTRKVVEAMAKHYGQDKRIWGWQIDNEPSHYGTVDFNPAAQENFRNWLKNKYKTIDALNKAWGTAFWSGVYSDFSQIELPVRDRLISGVASPTSLTDMKRFNADECASFISLQNKVLRENISSTQFVTTNFMNQHEDVDPWRNPDLDFISYTMYPVAGYTNGVGEQGFRLGEPWRISYADDFFRELKGVTGVMELQPGQVNWGKYNPQPYPGAVRMWLWNAFGGGVKFICSYRFRQPLFGGEQFHYGMVGTDGVTELTGGRQYSKFMNEIRDLRKLYLPGKKMPSDYAARQAAMVYNVDNIWETTVLPQTYQWNEFAHFIRYYSALKSLTVPVDIVNEKKDLSAYPVAVVPAYEMVDQKLVDKWYQYAENGGNLVVTVRTGLKDHNAHFFEMPWGGMISPLIGGKIIMFDDLADNYTAKVKFEGKDYSWNNWGDILVPDNGTEVWATYSDEFYKGKAGVLHRRLGKGTVTYVGIDTDDGQLERDVLKKVYETAGIPVQPLPEGVVLNWRDGFWVAVNYSSSIVQLPVSGNTKFIVGGSVLPVAGVSVWKSDEN